MASHRSQETSDDADIAEASDDAGIAETSDAPETRDGAGVGRPELSEEACDVEAILAAGLLGGSQ